VDQRDARPERTELQQVIVRMPQEMHAAIKDEAAKRDLTMSQLVRAAIRAHLDDPRVLLPS
jgi:predicted HicB family RNase H-like nuclease